MLLSEIIGLRQIFQKISTEKMNIKTSYLIAKFLNKTENEEKLYWEKVREVLQNYGEKDSEGNLVSKEDGSVSIQKDSVAECEIKLNEISNFEIEDCNLTLTERDLDSLDGRVELSPNEVAVLLKFIKE